LTDVLCFTGINEDENENSKGTRQKNNLKTEKYKNIDLLENSV